MKRRGRPNKGPLQMVKVVPCYVCGGTNLVKRAYVYADCPLNVAGHLVPCPRCEKKEVKK